MPGYIFADNNSTTPVDRRVLDEMTEAFNSLGNPASRHAAGRAARQLVDASKRRIAKSLDCHEAEIIFTSGATEANNQAILRSIGKVPATVWINPTEHAGAIESAKVLRRAGHRVLDMHVDQNGHVFEPLEYDRKGDASGRGVDPQLIILQGANSETGVLHDPGSFARRFPTARVHSDLTQVIGKVPFSFRQSGIASAAFSAHKFYGPQGTGALIIKSGSPLGPLLVGGHQQRSLRAGTEPVGLIVGLAAAVDYCCRDLKTDVAYVQSLRDRFERGILERVSDVVVNGGEVERGPGVANLSFLDLSFEALTIALDLAGVCCSAGSACASGSIEPSAALKAMGLDDRRLRGAVRFSFGKFNTLEEVDEATSIVAATVAKLRRETASVS